MDTFDALADPVRRDLILAVGAAPTSAGHLAERHPDISRPAVSRHLRVLTQTGVLVADAQGRHRIYRLAPRAFDEVQAFLEAASGAPATRVAGALDALETEVARARRDRRQAGASPDGDPARDRSTPSAGTAPAADQEHTA